MGHARIRGSRGWVTARGHPAGKTRNLCVDYEPASHKMTAYTLS